MECFCCGKYYGFFNENNEIMKLNKFGQFLCTQCYTPLNIGNKNVIYSTEKNKTELSEYHNKQERR